ncbi:DNA-binding transcriptional LysR family regulator [Halopolyspora algeriensis]|uniref:DNA-binding transcriptional LysR family regulator n=1 Tax=Halopolyspora algeriensis TaxID=1500506 RepID=A0A368VPD5_9ACTN|nr:LysR family transcriptional regulator [Halopolyspora algeriensis]RCW41000.1 DNA-binding transcriptional LysR family regulator [Halopolyspora algeriensis]TQM53916.1 DNA-binding transcriptional LysR family regulator [Halopolyspora algeriensis]
MTDFDLNLIRIFVLLYETRSVTATAEAVHVSQPTVSYSLGKLRRHFDDELFRRSRHGLVPTAVADRLYEPLQQSLAGIQHAIAPTRAFDPGTSQARFTIGLSDLGEASLLPRLLGPLQQQAPGVSLMVRSLDTSDSPRQLSRGEVDAFIATPILSSPQIRRIPLFSEGYFAMVASNHPRLRGESVSAAQLRTERHILVDGPSGHVGPKLALETLELLDHVALQVAKFSVLPYLVQRSEMVAIVPAYAGHAYAASHPVRLLQLPISLEPLEIALYALPERFRGPAQRWLVDFLHRTLAEQ